MMFSIIVSLKKDIFMLILFCKLGVTEKFMKIKSLSFRFWVNRIEYFRSEVVTDLSANNNFPEIKI